MQYVTSKNIPVCVNFFQSIVLVFGMNVQWSTDIHEKHYMEHLKIGNDFVGSLHLLLTYKYLPNNFCNFMNIKDVYIEAISLILEEMSVVITG